MPSDTDEIVRVRAASIVHHLDQPIKFGDWLMTFREFVLVRVDSLSGASGFAYCLTRNGPVAEIVRRNIEPIYLGNSVDDPARAFYRTLHAQHAVHAAGVGMRALSVVDIAAWDLACRVNGQSIAARLGGSLKPMPVTAIVGYPPTMSPEDIRVQVQQLWAAGWRRFKLAISPTLDATVARLEAVREVVPDGWVGLDLNFSFDTVADVLDFERRLRALRLGWIEDVFTAGNAGAVAEIRRGSQTPIAMGDDHGGSFYPEALLLANSADVVRVDVTTNGGVTRFAEVVEAVLRSGAQVAPHMFPHLHARLLPAMGIEVPIEWGIPGTGVHPMDDSLEQPTITDGLMAPLADEVGFGNLVDCAWIDAQEVADPDDLLGDL